MSTISSPGSHKADEGLARQVLKQSARSLSRSRSVWHFMAWSYVMAETAERDASSYKHGIKGSSGDVDLSKSLLSDAAVLTAADLDDNVYIANLDQGAFAGGSDGGPAGRSGNAHGEFTIAAGAGISPAA